MKWEIAKELAVKAAPVVIGVLLGIGGTKAVDATRSESTKAVPVVCACECKTTKPDPIKVEFVRPK